MNMWKMTSLLAALCLAAAVGAAVTVTVPGPDPKQPVEEQPEPDRCAPIWDNVMTLTNQLATAGNELSNCNSAAHAASELESQIKAELEALEAQYRELRRKRGAALLEIQACHSMYDYPVSDAEREVERVLSQAPGYLQFAADFWGCLTAFTDLASVLGCISSIYGLNDYMSQLVPAVERLVTAREALSDCLKIPQAEYEQATIEADRLTLQIMGTEVELASLVIPDCSNLAALVADFQTQLDREKLRYDDCRRAS